MKAITVKYLAPTNTMGARLKATISGGASLTMARDYEMDFDKQASLVAHAFANRLGWTASNLEYNKLAGGTINDGHMAFVLVKHG